MDIFDANSGRWSTAALSVARHYLAATSLPNQGLAIFAGGASNAVDIFDASSGRWSTAALSVARGYLAATSLPNQGLAIVAGGTAGFAVDDVMCVVCVVMGWKGGGDMSWVEGGAVCAAAADC